MSGQKVKKPVLTYTPTLGQLDEGVLLENCSVESHKIKCRI